MKITKNKQNGRSMVEMLGVLAIIGVLSIGGIAGYSKAMFKYKMNKTLDVLSHAIARLVELDSMKWGDDVIETPQDMIKYGIVSDCEETTFGGDSFCKLPNGDIWLMQVMSSTTYMMSLLFQNNPFDSCVAFFNSKIYNQVPEEWWAAYDEVSGGFIYIENENEGNYVYGKSEAMLSEGAKPELTATDVLDACDRYCKNNVCYIVWYLKYFLL